MAEINATGYKLKTQNEWYLDESNRYKTIDPKWNLDPSTPDGLKLATDSEIWANLDELGLKAYNSKDPSRATGADLDAVAALTGTIRGLGTFSVAVLSLIGTNGTIIPQGTLIESTEDETIWATDSEATIAGVTNVNVTVQIRGATQASIGDLTKIVNPISGLESVTNAAVATIGTNVETDAELRVKRNKAVSLVGQNQIDNTYSALSNLDGVRRVKIYENDSVDPVDANGLPIHSTAIVIDGGVDADIALAAYIKKNAGTLQHVLSSPTTVVVTSPVTGNIKSMTFNRPLYEDITLVYNVVDDGTLPVGAAQEIIDATLLYTDGDLLGDVVGFNQLGFGIGEEVRASRFYTPVNQVIGAYGNSYVTSITVNGVALVAINFESLARFTSPNISVLIT